MKLLQVYPNKRYFRIWTCCFVLAFSFTSCSSLPPKIEQKIPINASMLINECACGNAGALVDEQENPKRILPISSWNFDKCKSTISNPSAVIDLGAEFELEAVHYFDSYGQGVFEINVGNPFDWTPLLVDSMLHFQYWNSKTIKVKTRYIQLTSKNKIFPTEIIIEGKRIGNYQTKATRKSTNKPLFGDFMGTNAFVNDPLGLLSPFGAIREYHPWFAWNQPTEGQIAFNPTSQGFNFDLYYSNLKKMGIVASPVLQQSPKWLTGVDNLESKPLINSASPLDPISYKKHAEFIFQYSARYANGNVPKSAIQIAENQIPKINMDLLHYFENWNEQDKWWKGKESYFSPYEYAAMSSADFDGHLNAIGNYVGIKNADSTAKLVMGGLANPNIEYIKALKFWADHNRKGIFPWQVINIHHYSNDGGGQFQSKVGISPEDDHLREKLEVFTKYRDSILPKVEVWLSEFGYDCKDDSPQKAPEIGEMSREEVQAIWNVRAYLAAFAAGVDKAFQYMIRDGDGKGLYMSSGLYYWKKDGDKKEAILRPGWFYLSTLKKVLGDYRFEKEIKSTDSDILIYSFDSKSKNKVYAIWSKTSNGNEIKGYKFKAPADYQKFYQVSLVDKQPLGSTKSLVSKDGYITVDVSEKPVFIVGNNQKSFKLLSDDHMLKLTKENIKCESEGSCENLVDEQQSMGNPDMGIQIAKPLTNWETPYGKNEPASCYLDLGAEHLVTKLYIFDGQSSGNLKIYEGEPGNWKLIEEEDLNNYNVWKPHVLNARTRYLRITKANAAAGILEMAVYVK